MIITKTPLRVSFLGGGSDLPSFYRKERGAVVSMTIDKYVHIIVNRKFDESIRASYSVTEVVNDVNLLKHDRIRETFKMLGITKNVEIVSVADAPSGTGLGSSSSYTVGVLLASHTYQGNSVTPEILASQACDIEINLCQNPIGKQDQYIAAFGGFNYIQFFPDDTVSVTPIKLENGLTKSMHDWMLMLYTGITRNSTDILKEQSENVKEKSKHDTTKEMVAAADQLYESLKMGNIDQFGSLLHKGWLAKRKLAFGITSPSIDGWYNKALESGALGGKLLGAGGGGFLLLFAPPEKHQTIMENVGLRRMNFEFDPNGSRLVTMEG